MKKNNYFNNIENVLSNVVSDLSLKKGLKQQELVKLWPKIVGPRFQNSTRPLSIYSKNGFDVLTVCVSNSAAAQEMTFYKQDIINKIKKIIPDFGYNIRDIIFDQKTWGYEKSEKRDENALKNYYSLHKKFSEEEINNIELPESVIKEVNKNYKGVNFPTEELRKKFINIVIRDLKIREWQKKNGFPVCLKCGIPLTNYIESIENYCPVCRFI